MNTAEGEKVNENFQKTILIFAVSFLIINSIGYLFNITELITVVNNPTGGGGMSVSNIPTILSVLIACIILLIIKIKNKK